MTPQAEQGPNEAVWSLFRGEVRQASDEAQADPYYQAGSHPECVERVWDDLGAAVPDAVRVFIGGTPALAHPESGRVFATAFGTSYTLWLTSSDYERALRLGWDVSHRWMDGSVTDLPEDWVFGKWEAVELEWVRRSYEAAGC